MMPMRSRKSAGHDRDRDRRRKARSSGRRGDLVMTGHDKMGRPRLRPVAEKPRSRPARGRVRRLPERPRRVALDDRKYPNLAALRDLEHEEHVKRAMAMGLSKKEAQRHARHDERDGLRNPRLWPEPGLVRKPARGKR